ncbi:ArsR family transcriptional regulator [Microvirga terricola]|uniref:ArsR family transcriptional regulator n=1 Tax=Microvirga terricola TaxID=2719797 RepID=A0ABX0V6D2_9HYPH|nr:ArsR family transcriptional regulator [Microvirga terricola]NIX75399.1 ArsR family transcriptional regulator [Microvirga terricola]
MSLVDVLAKDRRLALLRFLSEADGYSLNASVLTTALSAVAHRVYRDTIEADLVLLEQHQLVTLERMPLPSGELICATLTALGMDVTNGRPHPVVARPTPKG